MYDSNPSGAMFGDIILLTMVALYAYCAFCQYRIAQNIGCSDNAWWAWIPIMNTLLLCDMAGKERWWFILCFIPLVNVIIFAVMWFEVARNTGFDGWMGLLVLLPLLNLVALGILAFAGQRAGGTDFPRSGQIDPAKYERVS